MLSAKVVKAAVPLTALWSQNNLVASAHEGSPLAMLIHHQRQKDVVNAVYYSTEQGVSELDQEARLNNIADNLAGNPLVGQDAVDPDFDAKVMDYYIAEDTKKIIQHLSIARNVVKPAVLDLAERIQAGMQAITAQTLLNANIVQFEVPESFFDVRFVGPLAKYQAQDGSVFNGNGGLPMMSWEELIKFLQVGIEEIDSENLGFITKAGTENILCLFQDVFSNQYTQVAGRNAKYLTEYFDDAKFGAQYTMAAYLLAENLYDNPVEGTNKTLVEFNQAMVQIRELAGARLLKQIKVHEQNVTDRVLVKSFGEGFVEVYANVYRTFLENGGSPEVLLGLIYSPKKNYTVDLLLPRAEELRQLWYAQCTNLKMTENTKRAAAMYRVALEALTQQMLAEQGEDPAFYSNMHAIIEQARKVLAEMKPDELNDLMEVAIRIECRARFPKSAAESFICDINEALSINPELAIEEAESIAVMRYITKYLAAQINLKFVR